MTLKRLPAEDQNIIQGCLDAVVSEIFIDGAEFEIITGVAFEAVKAIQADYPLVDEADDEVWQTIHGALLNLWGYPHRQERRWQEFISGTPQDVFAVAQRVKLLHENR